MLSVGHDHHRNGSLFKQDVKLFISLTTYFRTLVEVD